MKEGGGKTKDKGERKLKCKINAKRGKIKSKGEYILACCGRGKNTYNLQGGMGMVIGPINSPLYQCKIEVTFQ